MTGPEKTIPLLARDGAVKAWSLVDADDFEWLIRWTWRLHAQGYAFRGRKVGGRGGQYVTFLMHRVIMDLPHGCDYEVDHINGCKLDNRRSNLRVCSRGENAQNNPGRDNGLPRGVRWFARDGKWHARANMNGREVHLGYFDELEDARRAVIDWRSEHMPFATGRGA